MIAIAERRVEGVDCANLAEQVGELLEFARVARQSIAGAGSIENNSAGAETGGGSGRRAMCNSG